VQWGPGGKLCTSRSCRGNFVLLQERLLSFEYFDLFAPVI
jgi:hypothetical protein